MAIEKLSWKMVDTGMGWYIHEGVSENYGTYIIKKEDIRSFSIWWGGIRIGEERYWPSARREAQAHCNGLSHQAQKEQKE